MLQSLTLASLQEGESGSVLSIHARPDITRRLSDLGLVPGTRVTCVIQGTSKGPCAYLIRGALIALRRVDAADVLLLSHSSSHG